MPETVHKSAALLRAGLVVIVGLGFIDSPSASVTFDQLLEESSLRFSKPDGFEEVRPEANPLLFYQRALRRRDDALEIRYAIRPVARARIEYEDPHNAAPRPNHLFPLMFQSLVSQLAKGGNTPAREFSPQQARDQFNADWAAAAVFDVTREFSRDYRQALLLALHKDHRADAYVIFLFNDYAPVGESIDAAMPNLHFKD